MYWEHKLATLLRSDISRGEVRFDRETRTFWMWDGSRWLTAQQAPSGAAMPPYTPLPRRLSAEARAALQRVSQQRAIHPAGRPREAET
jgi:hypothetical protein